MMKLQFLFCFSKAYSQDRGGSATLMQQLLKDPDYYEQYQQKLARAALLQDQINVRMECDNMITLPAAIYFQNVINPDRTCLEQLAQDQILTVNQDFQGLNPEITSRWQDANSERFYRRIN